MFKCNTIINYNQLEIAIRYIIFKDATNFCFTINNMPTCTYLEKLCIDISDYMLLKPNGTQSRSTSAQTLRMSPRQSPIETTPYDAMLQPSNDKMYLSLRTSQIG